MNYVYFQSTGQLCLSDGEVLGTGYAGFGVGCNKPAMQNVHEIGPLPRGWYTIGEPYNSETHGPICFNLIPDKETETFGRDDFRLHADSITHPGLASKGCIVQSKPVRVHVSENIKQINRLEVVE